MNAPLFIVGALALVAFAYSRASAASSGDELVGELVNGGGGDWWGDDEASVSLWNGAAGLRLFEIPPAGEHYREAIARAEEKYSIPPSLLARVIYQESRFRPDIINGATRSSAGALGIAQFMPETAQSLGIDPLNASQAIDAAGRYLRSQFDTFGDWRSAIAAYNWGPGNWRAFQETGRGIRGQVRPLENVNYLSAILADVGV
jgi:soluble lytic murein transglycosylase-like protein